MCKGEDEIIGNDSQPIYHAIVRYCEDELVHDPVYSDRPADELERGVVGVTEDEALAVELRQRLSAHAARHRGDMVHIGLVNHYGSPESVITLSGKKFGESCVPQRHTYAFHKQLRLLGITRAGGKWLQSSILVPMVCATERVANSKAVCSSQMASRSNTGPPRCARRNERLRV